MILATINFDYLYIILALAAVLMIAGAIVLIVFFNKKKLEPTIDVSNIINAIGKSNIKNIEQVQKRVRIQVKDIKTVNLEQLKEVSNGVFITGDKLVLTFIDKTEEIVKALRREI